MTTTDLDDGQPARILIFDQCPLFARALSELIGEQVPGSVRRITHNANDALDEARNEHPDLMFIDLDGGDIGVTLLKDIKLLENAPRCVMRPFACRLTALSPSVCRCSSLLHRFIWLPAVRW